MKVIKWLDEHFEETFLVFFLVLISCITMLQIIARTFFARAFLAGGVLPLLLDLERVHFPALHHAQGQRCA